MTPIVADSLWDWIEGRRYLGLDVLALSRIALITTDETTTEKKDLTPDALLLRVQPPDHAVAPSSTTTVDLIGIVRGRGVSWQGWRRAGAR